MKYPFDKMTDRTHTYSLKWDIDPSAIPMWVADMDFETAPEIVMALQERCNHKIFGYTIVPKQWNEAIASWWKKRHDFAMNEENLLFCTGVVPAISSIVRKLSTPAENILIQTPVYNIFFNSILNNGRNVLESPLVYRDHTYSIDFADLEEKLSLPQTTMMILCNPHNPIGKIWDRPTLEKIGYLCHKHHVVVLSDEIHCDLTDPGCNYIPFASVNETCANISITCLAPTKAFNLAGLQTAAIYVSDPVLRHKVFRAINTDEIAEPNAFAIQAAIAAFTKGENWLDEVRAYLFENKKTVRDFLKKELPMLALIPSEATYLLWIDCKEVEENSPVLQQWLYKQAGLYLSDGLEYGQTGKSFLRMNIACPKKRLTDGLLRLKKGILSYLKTKE